MKSNRKAQLIISLLALGDMIMYLCCSAVARLFISGRFGLDFGGWAVSLIHFAFLIFFFFMSDLYSTHIELVSDSAKAAGASVLAATIASAAVCYIFSLGAIASDWLIRLGIFFVLTVIWRSLAASVIKKHGEKLRCIILENKNNASRLARKLKYASNSGRVSDYFMIDDTDPEEIEAIISERLPEYDEVFLSPAFSKPAANKIMSAATLLHKDVTVLADLDSITTAHGTITMLGDTPIVEKKVMKLTKTQLFLKRGFDIIFSLIGCVVTLPIFAVCALAARLDSAGSIIYKQKCYTKGKKIFTLYRFRTMSADAEKHEAEPVADNDPRLTKVGGFLRRSRLYKLPTLYNILFGQLSVVGPRPEDTALADNFAERSDDYEIRYFVKGGLTGYAQVYGKNNTRLSDKILMDMLYIADYSFLLDMKIIMLTVRALFIKTSDELDEQRDKTMSSPENEEKRRAESLRMLRGDKL